LPPAPDDAPADPTICPFCASTKIAAPRKKVDSSTYWRCESCNQMWNAGRQKSADTGPYRGGGWNGGR